jgi:O-antigen ligase
MGIFLILCILMWTVNRLHRFLTESVFPSHWDRTGGAGPTIESIGLLGLALMAFALGLGNTPQSIGMALLILASLAAWPTLWRGLRMDWVARLALIWFCYVLLRTGWVVWEMPELASMQWDRVRSVARILLFPVACWWLGGARRSLLSICILVLMGAAVGIFYYGDSSSVVLPNGSRRLLFGGDPRLHGLLYASILAGMIAFARAWWGPYTNKPIFFFRLLLWTITYLLLLWALIAVQARAAWFAGAITGLLFLAWFSRKMLRSHASGNQRLELAIALAVLMGTGAVLATFADKISHRVLEEHGTYALLLRGDVEKIEDPSLATRIYMFGVGWRAWLDRPLFGWGAGTSKYLISHADIPKRFHTYRELHNNYLEMLARFGIIGALLFFALWYQVVVPFARCWRAGSIPNDLGAFGISVSMIFFIVNLTDTYIDFQFGWIYMLFLCALLHSPLMQPSLSFDAPP